MFDRELEGEAAPIAVAKIVVTQWSLSFSCHALATSNA